jgi:DNA-binding beta-propeller fold protein YncE
MRAFRKCEASMIRSSTDRTLHLLALAATLSLSVAAAFAQEPALAVVEKKASQLALYNSSGERVASIPVGETPHEIVRDPNGRYLYVTDNGVLWMDYKGPGGNTISIIDLKEKKKAGVIDLGKYHRPHGMSIDPATRRMIVTSENPDSLVLVDLDKRAVIKPLDNGGEAPHMVMFDRKGEWAYASNTRSHNIAAVNIATGEKKIISGCGRPQGGVLTKDGSRYYVTCSDSGTIQIIDTAFKKAVGEIKTGKGVNRIEFTPDEKTLVYSIGGDATQMGLADVASGKETGRVELGGHPLSCTLSKNGKYAFAGVQDNDEIYVVSVADRKVIQVIKTPKDHGPDPVMEIGEYKPPAR